MIDIAQQFLAQWPTFTGLSVIILLFWKMFGKYLEEIKQVISGNKELSEQRASEIQRLRNLMDQLEKDRRELSESYQVLRHEFSKISLENASLKRLIVALEEMVRASGGDIKVIAKRVEANSEELREISAALVALPSPRG